MQSFSSGDDDDEISFGILDGSSSDGDDDVVVEFGCESRTSRRSSLPSSFRRAHRGHTLYSPSPEHDDHLGHDADGKVGFVELSNVESETHPPSPIHQDSDDEIEVSRAAADFSPIKILSWEPVAPMHHPTNSDGKASFIKLDKDITVAHPVDSSFNLVEEITSLVDDDDDDDGGTDSEIEFGAYSSSDDEADAAQEDIPTVKDLSSRLGFLDLALQKDEPSWTPKTVTNIDAVGKHHPIQMDIHGSTHVECCDVTLSDASQQHHSGKPISEGIFSLWINAMDDSKSDVVLHPPHQSLPPEGECVSHPSSNAAMDGICDAGEQELSMNITKHHGTFSCWIESSMMNDVNDSPNVNVDDSPNVDVDDSPNVDVDDSLCTTIVGCSSHGKDRTMEGLFSLWVVDPSSKEQPALYLAAPLTPSLRNASKVEESVAMVHDTSSAKATTPQKSFSTNVALYFSVIRQMYSPTHPVGDHNVSGDAHVSLCDATAWLFRPAPIKREHMLSSIGAVMYYSLIGGGSSTKMKEMIAAKELSEQRRREREEQMKMQMRAASIIQRCARTFLRVKEDKRREAATLRLQSALRNARETARARKSLTLLRNERVSAILNRINAIRALRATSKSSLCTKQFEARMCNARARTAKVQFLLEKENLVLRDSSSISEEDVHAAIEAVAIKRERLGCLRKRRVVLNQRVHKLQLSKTKIDLAVEQLRSEMEQELSKMPMEDSLCEEDTVEEPVKDVAEEATHNEDGDGVKPASPSLHHDTNGETDIPSTPTRLADANGFFRLEACAVPVSPLVLEASVPSPTSMGENAVNQLSLLSPVHLTSLGPDVEGAIIQPTAVTPSTKKKLVWADGYGLPLAYSNDTGFSPHHRIANPTKPAIRKSKSHKKNRQGGAGTKKVRCRGTPSKKTTERSRVTWHRK